MKKFIFIVSVIAIMLFSAIYVSAENAPITHTYLKEITNSGEYIFEIVITPTTDITYQTFRPIIAMYDSNNSLCGFERGKNLIYTNTKSRSIEIKTTPWNTPQTIKLMLWDWEDVITPISQYELVPTTVCDKDFGNIANIDHKKVDSGDYIFEAVIKSAQDATYTPVIRMYDASGNICGFKQEETITLSANKPVVKEFSAYATSAPSRISFTLRNNTEVAQCTTIPLTISTEKYGVIMEADTSKGVKLFATDGTYQYYDFADRFVLSYGNSIITNKSAAHNYLNTLRLKSYKRQADLYTGGKKYPDEWTAQYDWLILFNEDRYSAATPSSEKYYYLNHNDNIYKQSAYLNNYAKRMVRVMISPDGKITSMAFAGDALFKSVQAGQSFNEAYYSPSNKTFNDSLSVSTSTPILFLPTNKGATEAKFKVLSPSELKTSDFYYLKNFTTSDNKQIILLTYRYSDTVTASALASYNTETVKNINITLYGVNGTPQNPTGGINGKSIALHGDNRDLTDKANAAVSEAIKNIIYGLKAALTSAEEGHLISPSFVKNKCPSEVDIARDNLNFIQDLDDTHGTDYFNQFKNGILDYVPESALDFLYEYFIN